MQALSEFLSMGGYAAYVWSAYSLCLITLLMNLFIPLNTEKKILRRVEKKLERAKS